MNVLKSYGLVIIVCLELGFTTQVLSFQPSDSLVRISYNNQGTPVDLAVGLWANPLPMDYDEDGDLDLIVSCTDVPYAGTYFFENTSGTQNGQTVFETPERIGAGMKNISVSYVNNNPMVLGSGVEFQGFNRAVFAQPVGIFQSDLILSYHPKRRFNHWQYVDYEGDGDLDLIAGIDDWADYGWDNAFNEQGEWTNGDLHGYLYLVLNEQGTFVNKGRLRANGEDIDVYGNPTPNMVDFDDDGDLDIICGEFVDRFSWFENIGTRQAPQYAEGRFLENDQGLIKMDLEMMKPVAVDWNGDRHTDLIVGDEDGRVAYIENTGQVKDQMPQFKSPFYFKQQMGDINFGGLVTPFSVDWDDDGDEDLISGNTAGYIGFIENLGGEKLPRWAAPTYLEADGEIIRIMAGENGSIQGPCERKWGYTTLSVADWDDDGLKDIVVNSIWGKVVWYKNIGKKGAPKLTAKGGVKVNWDGNTVPKPAWNWWDPNQHQLVTQWRTTPYAIDWNKDGLMDLVMLDHEGYLAFYERFRRGSELLLHPGKRLFMDADQEDKPLRLNAKEAGGSGRRKFCFSDWDNDGDLDLLVNSKNVTWYENIEQTTYETTFTNRGDLAEQKLAGHTTSPTTVDWNQDGKPELLIGAEDGYFYYLTNK